MGKVVKTTIVTTIVVLLCFDVHYYIRHVSRGLAPVIAQEQIEISEFFELINTWERTERGIIIAQFSPFVQS